MIEWEEKLKLGVDLIDEQHKMLIQALQDIYEACARGEGLKKLEETTQFIAWYVEKHFKEEERLQEKIGYPHYGEHKIIHEKYRQEVSLMLEEFKKNELTIKKLSQMINYLLKMIKIHIRQEDSQIAAFIKNNAIELEERALEEDEVGLDRLTGLWKKEAFDEKVEQLLEHQKSTCFAYATLNVDGFNKVNKTYGYDIGEEIIIYISGILQQFVNEDIIIGRSYQDEFVLFIKLGNYEGMIKEFLEKIRKKIYEGLKRKESIVPLSASIGVALDKGDVKDIKVLAQRASIALSKAKEKGKNQVVFFEEEMYKEGVRSFNVIQLMQDYNLREYLEVFFQPIHDVKTHKVKGCEALLRLYNKEKNVISPVYFIPLAEENDLIVDIGYFCIEEVCRVYKRLQEKNIMPEYVSINLSVNQFKDAKLVRRIKEIAHKYEVDPKHLYFEIVESTLIQDFEKAKKIIKELKALGSKIMLDDFGSGYSSLSYLSRVDVDIVKVDKSFLENIRDNVKAQIILQNMVQLAHTLNLKTVIEGVETEAEWKWVEYVKGDSVQGFLKSRPLREERLMLYLEEN